MSASIHEHPEEWLAAALADGLSPEERRALDEHLAGCERCRELQADFAALDETLLRDFPLAVGPAGGFETRLVANFRQRRGRGWQLAKLRALAAWLVRQRGVQFAGVAAALLGLVCLGQTLTGDRRSTTLALNDARIIDGAIDQSAIENNMKGGATASVPMTRGFFKPTSRLNETRGAEAPGNIRPDNFLGSVPVGDIEVGRDVTAGFGEVRVPMLGDVPLMGRLFRDGPTSTGGSLNFGYFDRAGKDYQDSTSGFLAGNVNGGTTTGAVGGRVLPNGVRKDADASEFTSALDKKGLALLDGRRLSNGAGDLLPTGDVRDQRASAVWGSYDDRQRAQSSQNLYYRPIASLKGEVIPNPRFAEADGATPSPGTTPSPSPAPAGSPATAEAPAATPAPPDVRKLIRNARAELEVASFDATVDAITNAATRDGGFLDTRNSARGGNGKIQGTLVVKVLPEHLDRFLAGLRALGEVKNQTIQTEDVTKDYFDTDARLRNSQRMEARLLKMLDEVKGKMTEVLQVEKELARVRADIETMQGQLKVYDSLVRYATVALDVRERDLNQPAAFLLRETATLSLLTADVEKTAAEARRIADAAHAQTVRSEVTRDPSGKSRATLRLLISPDASADVIGQIKALGRVENFHVQDERTAQNGASSDAAAQDSAKVERAPVTLDLTISHDEQISRQVTLTLVAGDVEGSFEKARAAALAAGGEIVESNVTRPSAGHANATLGVRVPAAAETALLTSFQSLGRAGEAETRRVGNGPEADAGPVLIRLSVVDAEPAVQQTTVRVQTTEVERRAADIKREAAASHATVEESNFASESDGRQRAALRFRLPMSAYAEFVERVRALGTVKDFSVQRSDRPLRTGGGKAEADAPVVVDLLLYSEGRIVGDESGLGSTVRRTFGEGAGALMWSVRMIGVALAFLAPWVVLAAVVVGVVMWRRRSRKGLAQSPQSRKGGENG